jgi:hypothetical protein
MNNRLRSLPHRHVLPWALFFLTVLATTCAYAIPSFEGDSRLPGPHVPYEMTSGTVHYNELQYALYDIQFQVKDEKQVPPLYDLNFDVTVDINYTAVVSRALEPPHPVSGLGRARVVGERRLGKRYEANPFVAVFDTELVSLELYDLSPIPEVVLRESPTHSSTGVIIQDNICPPCLWTVRMISSYFDIFTELTFSGGETWEPANAAIHVEQAPDGIISGDYDGNGRVDTSDFVVWRKTLGDSSAGLDADGDWSGWVDEADYRVWRSQFGQTAAANSTAAQSAITNAPEPSTLMLLLSATLYARARRRDVECPGQGTVPQQ